MKHSHPDSKRAANDSLPCQTHTCTKTHTLVTKGMISAGGKKKSEAQTVHYGSLSRAPTPIPWPHNQCPVDGSQSTGASPNLMDATNSFTENHSIMRQRINVLLILPFNSNKRRGLWCTNQCIQTLLLYLIKFQGSCRIHRSQGYQSALLHAINEPP